MVSHSDPLADIEPTIEGDLRGLQPLPLWLEHFTPKISFLAILGLQPPFRTGWWEKKIQKMSGETASSNSPFQKFLDPPTCMATYMYPVTCRQWHMVTTAIESLICDKNRTFSSQSKYDHHNTVDGFIFVGTNIRGLSLTHSHGLNFVAAIYFKKNYFFEGIGIRGLVPPQKPRKLVSREI